MSTESRNSVLVGKIVSWPNMGDDDDDTPFIGAGRGEVVADLNGPLLLVRRISRGGDSEPSYMLVISMVQTGVHFYDTLQAEEEWYAWICNDPEPLVSLVSR